MNRLRSCINKRQRKVTSVTQSEFKHLLKQELRWFEQAAAAAAGHEWGHFSRTHDPPLSESDLSDDMTEPWLLLRILSEPLCSCSSRTRSSLCSQRRRPFSCSARSSCSCSFWKGKPNLRRDARAPSFWAEGAEDWLLPVPSQGVYLYVKLGSPQQVEGCIPHGVRWQRDLLLELLQALPQLSSSAKHK